MQTLLWVLTKLSRCIISANPQKDQSWENWDINVWVNSEQISNYVVATSVGIYRMFLFCGLESYLFSWYPCEGRKWPTVLTYWYLLYLRVVNAPWRSPWYLFNKLFWVFLIICFGSDIEQVREWVWGDKAIWHKQTRYHGGSEEGLLPGVASSRKTHEIWDPKDLQKSLRWERMRLGSGAKVFVLGSFISRNMGTVF